MIQNTRFCLCCPQRLRMTTLDPNPSSAQKKAERTSPAPETEIQILALGLLQVVPVIALPHLASVFSEARIDNQYRSHAHKINYSSSFYQS